MLLLLAEFQSTLPRRERRFTLSTGTSWTDFNPRSREGSDRNQNFYQPILQHFNPRSREGSDSGSTMLCSDVDISIHAPAKGATSCQIKHCRICQFQSTLPRRERHELQFPDSCVDRKFQSTLPRRERRRSLPILTPSFVFQSTLPRRERLEWAKDIEKQVEISIHAPAKGATTFFGLS